MLAVTGTSSSLLKELLELTRQQPVVFPDDPAVEIAENTWTFSRVTSDTATVDEVESALQLVGHAWLGSTRHIAPTTFYAWYDEQAGQLQVSMSSAEPADLPFGGLVQLVDVPRAVVVALMSDPHPGVILWEDLSPTTDEVETPDDVTPHLVNVWALTSHPA